MTRKILLATVLVLLLSGVSAQGNIVVFQCPASFRQTEQNIIRVREFSVESTGRIFGLPGNPAAYGLKMWPFSSVRKGLSVRIGLFLLEDSWYMHKMSPEEIPSKL